MIGSPGGDYGRVPGPEPTALSIEIEEIFGWIEQGAGMRQIRHRGLWRIAWTFTLTAAAYNLVRSLA